MTGPTLPDNDAPTFRDIVEIMLLPSLCVLVTAAATWLIWYYTTVPCTPEVAMRTVCNPAPLARYINTDVFGRMLTYALLVGGIGGLWKYDMIRKERAARVAAENRLTEFQKQAAEERQALLAALTEERQQAAQERQHAAEERQHAAQERAEFMTAISGLVSQVAQLTQQQNGTHGSGGDRPAQP